MTPHDIFTALASLLLPPGCFFLFLLAGFVFVRVFKKKWGAGLALLTLLMFWVGSTPALSNFLMERHIANIHPLDLKTPAALTASGKSAIVVLGLGGTSEGREYGQISLTSESYERLRYAANLARKTQLPILYAGGGMLAATPESRQGIDSEAAVARRTARSELDQDVRWIETKGITVRESAKYTAQILRGEGVSRIILVAHAWKMPRAIQEFQAWGLQVTPAPVGFPDEYEASIAAYFPTLEGLRWVRNIVRERLGMLRDGGF